MQRANRNFPFFGYDHRIDIKLRPANEFHMTTPLALCDESESFESALDFPKRLWPKLPQPQPQSSEPLVDA